MKLGNGIGCSLLLASSLAAPGQQPTTSGQQPTPTTDPQTTQPPSPATQAPATAPTTPAPMSPQILDPKPTAEPLQDSAPTAPAASGSVAGKPAAVDSHRYIIGAEDALQITVWREPSLSGTFPVRPDGMISMVLLGDLPASGMTAPALGADISQRLRKYFQDPPSVTVQVMAVNSQRIYMIGEVGHVGPVPLSSGMTPLQAIATAGGLSPFANSKHIYILRGTGASQQKIPFNYKQALKGNDRQPIVLRPGDTIVVP